MSEYRLYCLKNGRFISAEDFEADGDSAALEHVVAHQKEADCELWSGARFVATIELMGEPIFRDRVS